MTATVKCGKMLDTGRRMRWADGYLCPMKAAWIFVQPDQPGGKPIAVCACHPWEDIAAMFDLDKVYGWEVASSDYDEIMLELAEGMSVIDRITAS